MFNTNDFIFTSETTPQVTTDLKGCVKQVDELIGIADAVNVTDSPNCTSRLNSLLVASEIKRSGLDVILQLTGRDRNQIALESVLLGALSVGINKVLCLSVDQPGENGPAVVNEFNGNGLIELCKVIAGGTLSDGTEIKNPLTIYPGAADDLYTQISKHAPFDIFVTNLSNASGFEI